MSRIFLSHSSKDDFQAVAMRGWLNENGWEDVFLDVDPSQGIQPGERWQRELYEHAARCEAVLFLVSHNWLASDWCRREYELARKLNKRIFVILIDKLTVPELPAYLTETYQAVSLGIGEDHRVFRAVLPGTHEEGHVTFSVEGLARLRAGLAQAGLDPQFFAWPPANEPKRSPYRGLEPLESVDAGIFFGRDAPVIEALDALRGLREARFPRLFVILGASGAGKSSFLRAGLLPRLRRDDRAFLPLPAIRPERAAITGANGLVAALSAICAEMKVAATRAQLRGAASTGADALRPYLRELATRSAALSGAPTPPTIVIALDQAEELFRAEGAQEGDKLLALLRDLVSVDDPAVAVLFAIRSDSYDLLEHASQLEGMSQKAFPLLPMPRGAYQMVIEGPARRLVAAGHKLDIDPSLTAALLADIEKGGSSDALPLLAFTLEQLFADHSAAGRLTRADYENSGGLTGAIDAAMARVFVEADKDPRIPKDQEARLALLRRGLIPWLAGIDPETKTPRRRRAPAAQIPAEAQPLVDLLVEQRLLIRAVDEHTHTPTLEPAHEALLRQWGSLKSWLAEDFSQLVALEGVKRAARDWDANARDPAWVAHGGARLEEATRLDARPDLSALLDATDRAYLVACRARQNEVAAKEAAFVAAERRAAQRTRLGLVVSSVLAVLAAGAAVYGFHQADNARIAEAAAVDSGTKAVKAAQRATQRSAVLASNVARSYTAEGALDQALLLLLDGATAFDDSSAPDEMRIALTNALEKSQRIETRTLFPNMQVFETPDALVLINPATEDIWKLTDSIEPKRLLAGSPADRPILKFRQSGEDYVVLRDNLDVERINATNGTRRKIGTIPDPPKMSSRTYELNETRISEDGLVIRNFSVTEEGSKSSESNEYVQIFDTESGQLLAGDINPRIQRRASAGGFYGFTSEDDFVITATNGQLVTRKVDVGEKEDALIRYDACVAQMKDRARKRVSEEYASTWHFDFKCSNLGDDYLIWDTHHTSSGVERTDTIVKADGATTDVRDLLAKTVSETVSQNNIGWTGGYEKTTSDKNKLWLGVLLNRNAYVIEQDVSNQAATDDAWNTVLNYRHPVALNFARFLGPDRFVVVEAETGRIVAHDIGESPRKQMFAAPADNIIGSQAAIETFQHGTCVGNGSTAQMKSGLLPDGLKIVFDTSDDSGDGDKHELHVSGAGTNEVVVPFGEEAVCIQFSADWKRMVLVNPTGLTVYDLDNVIATGTLFRNAIATIPGKDFSAAFFVGAKGEHLVTANYTNSVLLWTADATGKTWKGREIYRGDYPIHYAEPDSTGDRLILIESRGVGDAHGLLYSVSARQIWYDLGSEYKRLGAAFTPKFDVAVAHSMTWTQVFPNMPLSALTAIAEKQLSVECHPPAAGQYRQSPCWPTSIK